MYLCPTLDENFLQNSSMDLSKKRRKTPGFSPGI